MIREVFEKGVASIVARYLLEGSAEALLARIAQSGALTPQQLDRLRGETLDNLQRVRDEGAPYAHLVMQALQEAGKALPLGSVASAAVSAAKAAPWRAWAATASEVARDVATRSAAEAAARVQQAAAAGGAKAAASGAPEDEGPAASSAGSGGEVGP